MQQQPPQITISQVPVGLASNPRGPSGPRGRGGARGSRGRGNARGSQRPSGPRARVTDNHESPNKDHEYRIKFMEEQMTTKMEEFDRRLSTLESLAIDSTQSIDDRLSTLEKAKIGIAIQRTLDAMRNRIEELSNEVAANKEEREEAIETMYSILPTLQTS